MVDIKCTFPKNKYKKQERTSNSENQDDESLLRQSIGSFCSGFSEAKKAYENGTDEVRQLIMLECCLIYECNVCRNMFRNLSNFICHKRKYCTGRTAKDFHSFPDRESSMYIQTVERSEYLPVKSRSTDSSPISNTKPLNRDICRMIERLKRVDVSKDINCNEALIDNKKELSLSEPYAQDTALEVNGVTASAQSAYQNLKTHDNIDSIKTDLDKVDQLLENKNIYLDEDGKATSLGLIPLTSSTDCSERGSERKKCGTSFLPEFSCQICKMQFETEKALKIHVEKNHTSTSYVFQCPTCTMTFLQPAAVIRHLANEHKKPLRRIRKMRNTILKKRIKIGDVQVKGMDREVRRLPLSNTKDKNNTSTVDQQNEKFISSCSYCSKIFEGRAALAKHLTYCLARNASLYKDDFLKRVKVPPQQKDETQIKNQISELLERNNQNDKIFSEEITLNIKQEPQEDLNTTNICNSNTINKMFENLENQTFGNGLHTVCLENIEMLDMNENSIEVQNDATESVNKDNNFCCNESRENKIDEHDSIIRNKSNKRGKPKRFHVISASKQLTCRCKICNKQFNALSNLRRHISMFHYRSKRFGCNLCDYRAFRRYDIVNHLSFVHKMTGERESMAIEYVTVHELKYSKNDVEGDIVLINEETIENEHNKRNVSKRLSEEPQIFAKETASKTFENIEKKKKEILKSKTDSPLSHKKDSFDFKVKSQVKVIRKKFKKSLETQVESKMRPIRNRIKTVNNDFVYDLLTIKEEPKHTPCLTIKRSNTTINDQNNLRKVELTPPPVKIIPYRLRTEPLIPADKSAIKGIAENVCRKVIHDGLAASSTLPELPTERPQMRTRLISASRSDLNAIPIIESSELEAAGLKSTFFDDSFLEKFAKKSNPTFKMKPLLAMQHSPLNSILQKFDASQQNKSKIKNNLFHKPPENNIEIPPIYSLCLLESLTIPSLNNKDLTPNNKQIFKPSSPPATPKKRITLMERLAENRAKRSDSFVTALEN